jgi:uncharacterized protein (DUF362 family)
MKRAAFSRRDLLRSSGAIGVGLAGYLSIRQWQRRTATAPPSPRPAVFVAGGQSYAGNLGQAIRHGLITVGIDPRHLRGKRVLLKPNLIEPSRSFPHITTHPAVVVAAAEVFRSWGADVVVGEGPGHVHDTEMALFESGLEEALDAARLSFNDLNYDDPLWVNNQGRWSSLAGFYLPRSAATADLIVSMPKLKTHHWIGMTASLKNLFGLLPGHVYGWPKNVLHHAGISQSVADLHASLPPTIAIVDGIDCMEGDGPIMGTLKAMGLLLVGSDLVALDATCARIMGLDPARLDLIQMAARRHDRFTDFSEESIDQRGDPWRRLASPFQLLDVPHLRALRPHAAGPMAPS